MSTFLIDNRLIWIFIIRRCSIEWQWWRIWWGWLTMRHWINHWSWLL